MTTNSTAALAPIETVYSCENCEWEGPESHVVSLTRATDRILPGELMPRGECPDCGAIAWADADVTDMTLGAMAAIMADRGWFVASPEELGRLPTSTHTQAGNPFTITSCTSSQLQAALDTVGDLLAVYANAVNPDPDAELDDAIARVIRRVERVDDVARSAAQRFHDVFKDKMAAV